MGVKRVKPSLRARMLFFDPESRELTVYARPEEPKDATYTGILTVSESAYLERVMTRVEEYEEKVIAPHHREEHESTSVR